MTSKPFKSAPELNPVTHKWAVLRFSWFPLHIPLIAEFRRYWYHKNRVDTWSTNCYSLNATAIAKHSKNLQTWDGAFHEWVANSVGGEIYVVGASRFWGSLRQAKFSRQRLAAFYLLIALYLLNSSLPAFASYHILTATSLLCISRLINLNLKYLFRAPVRGIAISARHP